MSFFPSPFLTRSSGQVSSYLGILISGHHSITQPSQILCLWLQTVFPFLDFGSLTPFGVGGTPSVLISLDYQVIDLKDMNLLSN